MTEERNIEYNFRGDVSSLRNAVETSLSLLKQFEKSGDLYLQNLANLGNGSAAFKQLEATLRGVTTQFTNFNAVLKVSENNHAFPQIANLAAGSLGQLHGVIATLTGNTKLSSAETERLTLVLKNLKSEFEILSMAAQGDAAAIAQVTAVSAAATQQTEKATETKKRKKKATEDATSATIQEATATANVAKENANAEVATDKLSKALERLDTSTKHLNSSMVSITKVTAGIGKAFTFLQGAVVGKIWTSAVKESIAYVETLNLFRVALDDSLAAGNKFVDTMQELYGLDPETIMRHTAIFYNLGSAVGVPDAAAEKLSMGLTKLGTDLASLFNLPVDQVMSNMESGMQGMTRAVRKYGMDIRMTTLETTALSLGLEVNARTLNEADRQGLRYITMINQAKNASGDFARTLESPANQLKIATEQIKQFARAVGNFFIGMLAKVLPYINGFIMAIRTLLDFISALFGFQPMEFGDSGDFGDDVEEGMGGIGDAADGAGKKAKKLQQILASFDEVHILTDPPKPSASAGAGTGYDGSMDPKIMAAIEAMEAKFENIRMKANDVRDTLLAFFGFEYGAEGKLSWTLDNLEASLSKVLGTNVDLNPIIRSFETLKFTLEGYGAGVLDRIKWFWDNVLVPFGLWAISDAIPAFFDALRGTLDFLSGTIESSKPFFMWMWDHFLVPIGSWTGGIIVTTLQEMGDKLSWLGGVLEDHEWITSSLLIIVTGHYVKLGIEAIITMGKQVLAWVTSKAEAIRSTAIMIAQFVLNIAKWIALGTTAVSQAAFIVGAWIAQKVEAISSVAAQLVQFVIMGAKWVWLGITSLAAGAQMAAAWLIAAGPIAWIVAAVIAAVALIILNWDSIVAFIKNVGPRIATAARGMWDGIIDEFKSALNWIIDKWNAFKLAVVIPSNVMSNALGLAGKGFSINTPNMQRMAEGGIVRKPTVAMVGEGKYEEAVIPLGNSPQMKRLVADIANAVQGGSGDSGDITIPVYVAGKKIEEVVVKRMNRANKRVGGGLITV